MDGKVFCLKVKEDGSVEVLDEASSGGAGPCHLAVLDYDSGHGLAIAHVSFFPRPLPAVLPCRTFGTHTEEEMKIESVISTNQAT